MPEKNDNIVLPVCSYKPHRISKKVNRMTTADIKIPVQLQSFVRYIQVLEQTPLSGVYEPVRFYADGSPGIMFVQSENSVIAQQDNILAPFSAYGQTVKPIELQAGAACRVIVVGLYPHIIKPLLGINSSILTDGCVDMKMIAGKDTGSTIEQLLNEPLLNVQLQLITNYLFQLYQSTRNTPDALLAYAVAHITQNRGQASLKGLRSYLNVPERTFERKFEQHVGISAKLFTRICQFQSGLQQLQQGRYEKLSDIAYENGYADQSHFIRSFNEFTGQSPLEFIKQQQVQRAAIDFNLPGVV